MNVSEAQLANIGDTVVLDDPSFPYRVQVRLHENTDRPAVTEFVVRSRDGDPITSATLAQIPVRQIASVAASAMAGEAEAQYRMLARPRPYGVRSWPEDHYERVARVVMWARRIGRPGGAAGVVSEFWDVHQRTARRWIARALGPDQVEDRPSSRTQ